MPLAKELDIRIPSFGHAGDGNLHIYICRDSLNDAVWKDKLAKAMQRMYEKAQELNGQVSGEHGIGFAKRGFLAERLGENQLALMKGIKLLFDPKKYSEPREDCLNLQFGIKIGKKFYEQRIFD